MKNKFKSYSFWMSVAGAVVLVLNNIGKVCGFAVDSKIVTEIVDSVCGVLILFGVITMSKTDDNLKDDIESQDVNEKQDDLENEKSNCDNKKQNK